MENKDMKMETFQHQDVVQNVGSLLIQCGKINLREIQSRRVCFVPTWETADRFLVKILSRNQ